MLQTRRYKFGPKKSDGCNLLWKYMGGMKIVDLEPNDKYLSPFNKSPEYHLLLCGGNDNG